MFHKKESSPTAVAVIVAAGNSCRMGKGTNKQFIEICGMPILAHTLLQFHKAESIDSIIVVTRPDSILTVWDMIREFGISKIRDVIPGGETRQDSVICGLSLVENSKLVAIHDGARPFISVDKINELVYSAHKFGSATPGVVPKDTIKSISDKGTVFETIDRESLRLIQTPQVFHADELKLANEIAKTANFIGTDDCSLFEHAGFSVHIIDGEYTNIKITTPEDVPVAEAIWEFLNK